MHTATDRHARVGPLARAARAHLRDYGRGRRPRAGRQRGVGARDLHAGKRAAPEMKRALAQPDAQTKRFDALIWHWRRRLVGGCNGCGATVCSTSSAGGWSAIRAGVVGRASRSTSAPADSAVVLVVGRAAILDAAQWTDAFERPASVRVGVTLCTLEVPLAATLAIDARRDIDRARRTPIAHCPSSTHKRGTAIPSGRTALVAVSAKAREVGRNLCSGETHVYSSILTCTIKRW